jgi:hypothetical protein
LPLSHELPTFDANNLRLKFFKVLTKMTAGLGKKWARIFHLPPQKMLQIGEEKIRKIM